MHSKKKILASLLVATLLVTGYFAYGFYAKNKAEGNMTVLPDAEVGELGVLRIAVLPTVDCLPFFYAEAEGIYDTLGIPVSLVLYESSLDCDTAFLNGGVHGGVTDTLRLDELRKKGLHYTPIWHTDSHWALVGNGGLRMRRMMNLKGRTVASERFSLAEHLVKEALRKHNVPQEEILTPQINSLYLRTSMLDNNQIDAAMLPEPFITMAEENGHRKLYTIDDAKLLRLGCVAFADSVLMDSLRKGQVDKLFEAYRIAASELNKKGLKACRSILTDIYAVPKVMVDSVKLPLYSDTLMVNG